MTLRKALADAVEDGLVEHNVVDSAHKLPTDRAEMSVWTPEQLRAFLAYVAGDRLSALWRLAGTTGMRRGELLGPRWTDLDLDEGLLNVAQTRVKGGGTVGYGKPKTAKGRRAIALDSVTIAMLKAHRKAQAEERLAWGPGYVDEGLVFCREDGRPVDPDVLSQRFERLAREAGLPRIRLHDLRHTYATAALRAGVPVKVVSERLGHATPAITLAVYATSCPGWIERPPSWWLPSSTASERHRPTFSVSNRDHSVTGGPNRKAERTSVHPA